MATAIRSKTTNDATDVAFGYDIIDGADDAHAKMVKVMQDDIKASKKLETLWVKRTTKTPEEFAEFVAKTAKKKGVKCQRLDTSAANYGNADWAEY